MDNKEEATQQPSEKETTSPAQMPAATLSLTEDDKKLLAPWKMSISYDNGETWKDILIPASRVVYLMSLQSYLLMAKQQSEHTEDYAKILLCGELFNGAEKGTNRKTAVTLAEAEKMLLDDPVIGVRFELHKTLAQIMLPLFRTSSLLNATVVLTKLEKEGGASSSIFSLNNPHLQAERGEAVQELADNGIISAARQIIEREAARARSEVVASVGPEKGTILGADGSPVAKAPNTPFKPTAIIAGETVTSSKE